MSENLVVTCSKESQIEGLKREKEFREKSISKETKKLAVLQNAITITEALFEYRHEMGSHAHFYGELMREVAFVKGLIKFNKEKAKEAKDKIKELED